MRQVIVNPRTHKVHGIRGLYWNKQTGRFWVRYSKNGVDRQHTFTPENATFSGLTRRANVELNHLKRIINNEVENNNNITKQSTHERSKRNFIKTVEDIFRDNVNSQTMSKYKRYCDGFILCKTQSKIEYVNEYNKSLLREKLNTATSGMKLEIYSKVQSAFNKLISLGLHRGINPCAFISRPRNTSLPREGYFECDEIKNIINHINNNETKLYFEMCVITGQRPVDVRRLDLQSIKQHIRFYNTKTNRYARVSHYIPNDIIERCKAQQSWTRSQDVMTREINETIRKLYADDRTLYYIRHSFITIIKRITGSNDDAQMWTHSGRNAAEIHYIHEDQSRADEILKRYLTMLGYNV